MGYLDYRFIAGALGCFLLVPAIAVVFSFVRLLRMDASRKTIFPSDVVTFLVVLAPSILLLSSGSYLLPLLLVVNMSGGWLVGWTAYRHSALGGDLSKVQSAINAIGWSLTMPFVSGLVALMLPRAN